MTKKLSTGETSTLGNWYRLCKAFFGEDSPATMFIRSKLDDQGDDMEVVADEGQLLHLLGKMHLEKEENAQ